MCSSNDAKDANHNEGDGHVKYQAQGERGKMKRLPTPFPGPRTSKSRTERKGQRTVTRQSWGIRSAALLLTERRAEAVCEG